MASELARENRELRTANEILKKASAYFAMAKLDRIRRESRPPDAFPILLIASEGLNAIGSREGPNAFIDDHREVHGVEPICRVSGGNATGPRDPANADRPVDLLRAGGDLP